MKRVIVGLVVAMSGALGALACTGDGYAIVVTSSPDSGSEPDAAVPVVDAQAEDAAVEDVGSCSTIVYPVGDGSIDDPTTGFLYGSAPDGTIRKDPTGIVLTSAANQVAVLVAQLADRASITRLTVRGEVTVRPSSEPLAPVGVFIGDGASTVGHVDLVRGIDGNPGLFYGKGTDPATMPLGAGKEASFPNDIEVPFQHVFRGAWKDGPTVELTVGGQVGAVAKVAGYTPPSNNDQVLNIAVGVAPPQSTATTVRLHAFAVDVCRK